MLKWKWKWLWLLAGIISGTIFSASSEERKTLSLELSVPAVSLEDAQDRVALALSVDDPRLNRAKVMAVFRPVCRLPASEGDFYPCEAKVVLQ